MGSVSDRVVVSVGDAWLGGLWREPVMARRIVSGVVVSVGDDL